MSAIQSIPTRVVGTGTRGLLGYRAIAWGDAIMGWKAIDDDPTTYDIIVAISMATDGLVGRPGTGTTERSIGRQYSAV